MQADYGHMQADFADHFATATSGRVYCTLFHPDLVYKSLRSGHETMINTYLLLAWMQLSGFYPSNSSPSWPGNR